MVKLRIFIGQITKIIVFSLLYYFYSTFLDNLTHYTSVLNSQCLEENAINNLINIEREVFSGDLKYIYGENPTSYFVNNLNSIFNTKEFYDNVTLNYKDSLQSDYMNSYDNITNTNICFICNDNFSALNLNCSQFMYNSTSYGLNSAISSYIQELRQIYANYINLKSNNLESFQIFSSTNMQNLDIQLIFIIRPGNEILTNDLYSSISSYISFFDIIYIVSFVVILTLVLIKYLFIWKPFEDDLSQTIHKTKNMLCIIPKEILAGLNNINKLLEIGNFDKKKIEENNQ